MMSRAGSYTAPLIFVCIAIVCLIIGLPTFLVGCNATNYKFGCVAYSVVDAHVQKSWIDIEICQNCYNDGTMCDDYICYGAFVDWNVCTEKIGTWWNKDNAEAKAALYRPGDQYTVWITKAKPVTCTSDGSSVMVALPIVGITFFTLTGFFLILACTIGIAELCSTIKLASVVPRN